MYVTKLPQDQTKACGRQYFRFSCAVSTFSLDMLQVYLITGCAQPARVLLLLLLLFISIGLHIPRNMDNLASIPVPQRVRGRPKY